MRRAAILIGILTVLFLAGDANAQDPATVAPEAPPAETTAPPADPVDTAAALDAAANPEDAAPAEADALDEVEVAAPAGDAAASEAPAGDDADAESAEDAESEDDEAPAVVGADWKGLVERTPAFLAKTHHAAVHLPIALWLFGAFFVVVGTLIPSWRNQIPLACLIGGALTSVAAVASGWWYAAYEYGEPWAWGDGFGDWSENLVMHRWLGMALAFASIFLSILALISQARQSRRLGFVWRVGLLMLAAAVAWEGHLGGEMIQGEGFFEEAFQTWVTPTAE